MTILRIVTYDSPGLLNDATIYKNAFKRYKYTVIIKKLHFHDKNISQSKTNQFCDINLFLETIGYVNYASGVPTVYDVSAMFPSKINLFMPNHEIFFYQDGLKYIDYVLCKTKIAMDMFTSIAATSKFGYECIYTKFTTYIPHELRFYEKTIDKNVNLFVHLAGKSPFKNTNALLYTWIKHNGFTDIDPDIKLVVTCYSSCLNKTVSMLKDDYKYDIKLESIPGRTDVKKIGNIVFYITPAPMTEYTELLRTANVAICISKMEGFGHYINEARYFGTYVISINYPPMNELVINNVNGLLIDNYTKTLLNKDKRNYNYDVYGVTPDLDELANKIIYCIKNKSALKDKSWTTRKMFFSDIKFFEKAIGELVIELTRRLNISN